MKLTLTCLRSIGMLVLLLACLAPGSGSAAIAARQTGAIVQANQDPTTLYLPIATAFLSNLPTPRNLAIVEDDRVATLTWNTHPNDLTREGSAKVTGYLVTWGPQDHPTASRALTERRTIQLQPLENGKPYVVRIQAVDSRGNLSTATAARPFTGDPTRVERLRRQMNGFFDDFNLSAGMPDELKWNSVYSLCNDQRYNSFMINDQFHVHNTVRSDICDRGHSLNRARRMLSFSDNGTRTIVFDLDGVDRRNIWYLHLTPQLQDIMPIDLGGASLPNLVGALQFRLREQVLVVSQIAANGEVVDLAYAEIDEGSRPVSPNVRRAWEIKVSRSSVEVRIDGERVLTTPPGALNLTEQAYHVLWSLFSYNTTKGNQPYVLMHWDNFGFDAPVGPANDLVTHNYRLINAGSDLVTAVRAAGGAQPVTLNIPDRVDGALAQRLLFIAQPPFAKTPEWRATDRVFINGQPFPIPQPVSRTEPPLSFDQTVSVAAPYTYVIDLPAGVLRQGQNTLRFDTQQSWFHSIHAELDFPAGAAPTFTPPARVASGTAAMPTTPIGPEATILQIGSTELEIGADYLNDPQRFQPTVSGVVPVRVEVTNAQALEGTGRNTGVRVVELLVDRQVVAVLRTDAIVPAPAVRHTFQLDTRWLTNGVHQLAVRAYNAQCVPSIPGSGIGEGESGRYSPIHIAVANTGTPMSPPVLPTPWSCTTAQLMPAYAQFGVCELT